MIALVSRYNICRWMNPIPEYEGRYSVEKNGMVWSHVRNRWLKAGLAGNGYMTVNLGANNSMYVHRLMAATFLGLKSGQDVDHINRDRTDNRIENLRVCSRSQNLTRRRSESKSGFRGVIRACTKSERWVAQISGSGGRGYLGCFQSKKEAAIAYDVAAKSLFGEFAELNFP